jgi:hypothetical protein
MGKAEILSELPKLEAEDRKQVFERLCQLEEEDLLNGVGPTDQEKKLLDQALLEYERDGDLGIPWRDALRQIRNSKLK